MLALVMAAMLMGTGEVDFEEEYTVKVTQINRYVVGGSGCDGDSCLI